MMTALAFTISTVTLGFASATLVALRGETLDARKGDDRRTSGRPGGRRHIDH